MTALAFDYSIRLPFVTHQVGLDWLSSKFLATLDALTEIDANIFPDWEIGDLRAMKGYPLAIARSRVAEIIGQNVSRYELENPGPERGYTAVAKTIVEAKSRQTTVWIGQGNVRLETGDWKVFPDPAIVTFPLFKAALLAFHSIWPSPWACVQAFRSVTVKVPVHNGRGYRLDSAPMIPAMPTFPESIFHIPWIGYLSAPLASGIELPSEIRTERMPDGGLLMIATEERLDPDNPEHARRARVVAETMIAQTGTRSSRKK